MNLRDIHILVTLSRRGVPRERLCRILTDPLPDNYAIWDSSKCGFTERHMSRFQAQNWCKDHSLPDYTEK